MGGLDLSVSIMVNNEKRLLDECIAEFFGTYVFLTLGIAVVAGLKLGGAIVSQVELAAIWVLAVTLGIYVGGSVSGAHLNPSVTVALACFADVPVFQHEPMTEFWNPHSCPCSCDISKLWEDCALQYIVK